MDDIEVEGLEARVTQYESFDRTYSGPGSFGVRVNPSGRKSFFLIYNINGRRKRTTLGRFPDIGIEEARLQAHRLSESLRAGKDPGIEIRLWKVPSTFSEVSVSFFNELGSKGRSEKTITEYTRIMEAECLPVWGDRLIGSIRQSDIIFLLDRIAGLRNSPVMARRVYGLLSTFFKFAVSKALIESSPLPEGYLEHSKAESSAERIIETEFAKDIFSLLRVEESQIALIYQLLIVTGQKPSEVCQMKWSDLQLSLWQVYDGENIGKRLHQITIPPIMVKALEDHRRNIHPESEYVFPSPRKSSVPYISNIRKYALKICEVKGISPFTPADLRRSFPNWLLSQGVRPDVIERILNRNPGNTHLKGYYRNLNYEEDIKRALAKWARYLSEGLKRKDDPEGGAKVVPLFG
jgi:integrase